MFLLHRAFLVCLSQSTPDAKSQETCLLDIIFPKLDNITITTNQSFYTILKRYPSTKAISRTKSHTLPSIKNFNSSTALKIKDDTKLFIETTYKSLEFALLQAIKHYQNQINDTDSLIYQLM